MLITLDGFRWQEVFNGGDSSFMRQQQHLKDPKLKEKFWRDDLSERRKALLPFFWNTIAAKGQLYGNRSAGCKVNVTNNQWFSYPGYNEILTGSADNERIHSNDKLYNPNTNVLEFINAQAAFKGKVAAFTSWDVFPYIINDKRNSIFRQCGIDGGKGRQTHYGRADPEQTDEKHSKSIGGCQAGCVYVLLRPRVYEKGEAKGNVFCI